jgi:hypothetical protein
MQPPPAVWEHGNVLPTADLLSRTFHQGWQRASDRCTASGESTGQIVSNLGTLDLMTWGSAGSPPTNGRDGAGDSTTGGIRSGHPASPIPSRRES